MSPAEVAPLLGLSLTAVTAVRRSARDGLRQAYLQLHRARVTQPECAQAAARLGPFVRDAVPGSDSALVTGHLSECDDCRAAYTDLADIGLTLRTVVAPAVLGDAAAGYLASAGQPGTAQAAAGDSMTGGAAAAAWPGLDQAAGTAQSCDAPAALARGWCRRRDCGRRYRVCRDAQQPWHPGRTPAQRCRPCPGCRDTVGIVCCGDYGCGSRRDDPRAAVASSPRSLGLARTSRHAEPSAASCGGPAGGEHRGGLAAARARLDGDVRGR